MKINWRWPEDKRKGRPPWFVILRRTVFLPLIYAGAILVFVAMICAYGYRAAIDWFGDCS